MLYKITISEAVKYKIEKLKNDIPSYDIPSYHL